MKAIFRRQGDTLVPACTESLKILARCEQGQEVLLDYKKGRSPNNHRRFFAFINLTFEMQDDFEDLEVWRKYLEACAGHFTQVISPKTNQPMIIVDSIAWDELNDENEFRELFNRVINAFVSRYGQGLDDNQLTMVTQF